MAKTQYSAIPFVDRAWPIVTGCTKTKKGCDSCFAARLAATRLKHHRHYKGLAEYRDGRGHWIAPPRFNAEILDAPLRWRKAQRIFVAHTGDLFHKQIRPRVIHQAFAVMLLAQQHTFMVFTKRWKRMRDILDHPTTAFAVYKWATEIKGTDEGIRFTWPPPNVWLIHSASTQDEVDECVPRLVGTPAAKRGLSLEPLLEDITLQGGNIPKLPSGPWPDEPLRSRSFLRGITGDQRLNFIIAGGETSLRRSLARPCPVDAARSLRDQCRAAGVPLWFKGWGSNLPDGQVKGLLDGVRYEELPTAHAVCPRCDRAAEEDIDAARDALSNALYGKVSEEEYLAAQAVASQPSNSSTAKHVCQECCFPPR